MISSLRRRLCYSALFATELSVDPIWIPLQFSAASLCTSRMPVRQGLQLYSRTGNITLVTYLDTHSLDDILDGFKTNEQFEEEKVSLFFVI